MVECTVLKLSFDQKRKTQNILAFFTLSFYMYRALLLKIDS